MYWFLHSVLFCKLVLQVDNWCLSLGFTGIIALKVNVCSNFGYIIVKLQMILIESEMFQLGNLYIDDIFICLTPRVFLNLGTSVINGFFYLFILVFKMTLVTLFDIITSKRIVEEQHVNCIRMSHCRSGLSISTCIVFMHLSTLFHNFVVLKYFHGVANVIYFFNVTLQTVN